MAKYRKKPIIVDAIQWNGDNYGEIKIKLDSLAQNLLSSDALRTAIYVLTLEGLMKAQIGDWIIKGITGELYPCKPDIFEKTYESVE